MTEDSQQLNGTSLSGDVMADAPAPTEVVPGGPGGKTLIAAVLMNWAAIFAITLLVMFVSEGALENADEMKPQNILVMTLLTTLATFLIVWYFTSRRYGKTLIDGLLLKGVEPGTIKKWAFISALAAVVAGTLLMLVGEEEGLLFDLVKQPGGLAIFIVMALLLPPFEEFYYRGLILPVIARKIGVVAVPVTALWFTSAHLPQLWGNWVGVAVIAAMGTLWSLLRYRYNSLLPSIASHWCYNATLVVITIGQVGLEAIGVL